MIFKESFEYCPYIREMMKESKRNAEVRDNDTRIQQDLETDIPETTRLKAHLKRRVERQTKNKWIQYATEYASEIVLAGPEEKDKIRRYMEMTREAVESMNRKDRDEKAFKRDRRVRTHEKHAI